MEMSTHKNCRLEIVFDSLLRSLSILLLIAIGVKLIGPHSGLQVDKHTIERESSYVEWPRCLCKQYVIGLETLRKIIIPAILKYMYIYIMLSSLNLICMTGKVSDPDTV